MDDMPRKREQRWAWVLTGSGHFFDESIALMKTLDAYDVFVSKAAEEVLRMYRHKGKIFPEGVTVYRDTTASAAPVGRTRTACSSITDAIGILPHRASWNVPRCAAIGKRDVTDAGAAAASRSARRRGG